MSQKFISIFFSLMMLMPLAYADPVTPIALELAGHTEADLPTIKLSNDELLWLAKKK